MTSKAEKLCAGLSREERARMSFRNATERLVTELNRAIQDLASASNRRNSQNREHCKKLSVCENIKKNENISPAAIMVASISRRTGGTEPDDVHELGFLLLVRAASGRGTVLQP